MVRTNLIAYHNLTINEFNKANQLLKLAAIIGVKRRVGLPIASSFYILSDEGHFFLLLA